MIARIQSLYLLLVAALAVGSMFFPFWSFSAGHVFLVHDLLPPALDDQIISATSFSGRLFSPLTAIAATSSVLLFKNRELQSRLIFLAILFFLGDLFSGLTAAHFMNEHFKTVSLAATHHPEAGFFMLLPEPVLLLMALKGVKTDEKIANAYKRL